MLQSFYTSPPTYRRLQEAIYCLRGEYPALKVYPIGRSTLGRGLFALTLGEIQRSALYVGAVHGSEWLTALLLMRFCEDVCMALKEHRPLAGMDITHMLEGNSITIIPCLNPDGVEIAIDGPCTAGRYAQRVAAMWPDRRVIWQANARGVDLNHNFDAGFEELRQLEIKDGITGPGPTKYGGPAPFSECESRALAGFCRSNAIRQSYAFHSQGEEIYYKYGEHTPTRSRLIAQVLGASCGYRVATPRGTASHGGFKDWFIDKLHRPGFTFEIGRGRNPLPIAELEPIYARLIETLLLATVL